LDIGGFNILTYSVNQPYFTDINMRVLVQRVKKAKVLVSGNNIAEIGRGLLLFVGIGKSDTEDDIAYTSRKVANLRIFYDQSGKMNLNVYQVEGQILSVSQFTLYADTNKGNRPGFDQSADPDTARKYWVKFNELLRAKGLDVKEGEFGASMEVDLVNDGPVTIWISSDSK
jgi:D-tyrosyl-tRNA(Tyr) deacylase